MPPRKAGRIRYYEVGPLRYSPLLTALQQRLLKTSGRLMKHAVLLVLLRGESHSGATCQHARQDRGVPGGLKSRRADMLSGRQIAGPISSVIGTLGAIVVQINGGWLDVLIDAEEFVRVDLRLLRERRSYLSPYATVPAASVPPSPAPEARATAQAGPPAGNAAYYCGTDRWPVKTLSDEDRNRVNLKPVPSTVAELDALPRPPLLPDNRRAAPVELTTYVVRAVLVETSSEKDNDIHVVIADPADRSKTMITEVVDPGCQGAISSPELADFRRVRETLDLLLRSPTTDMLVPLKRGDLIEVTGVGFFDTVHGQNGVAPRA